MKTINFVTSNENKLREFRLLLEPGYKINVLKLEYPELKSDDNSEIARIAAKMLAERIKKAIIVEDSGLFIDSLNGFPGTNSKWVHRKIGIKGLLKLLKGVKNRKCYYKSAIGYCEPGKEPVSFLGVEEGKVAFREKGKYGWGHDPIFIPKGKKKTYGELRKNGAPNLFRVRAIEKLKKYLASGNY